MAPLQVTGYIVQIQAETDEALQKSFMNLTGHTRALSHDETKSCVELSYAEPPNTSSDDYERAETCRSEPRCLIEGWRNLEFPNSTILRPVSAVDARSDAETIMVRWQRGVYCPTICSIINPAVI